jgi:hypothetical protein
MKVFRDLYITGDDAALNATVEEIGQSLSDDWRRSRDMESQTHARGCFTCEANETRAAATVFLIDGHDNSLSVTNIVPTEPGALSYDQYNAILEEFHDRFAVPAAKKMGVAVEITPDEKGIGAWLSKDAVKKLQSFSSAANKSTGSAHPSDLNRWFAFLLAAHEEQSQLDSTTLSRWLVETERWGEEVASDLVIEYEFGRGLLTFADAHRTDK